MFTANYVKYKKGRFLGTEQSMVIGDGTTMTCTTVRADAADIGAVIGYGKCASLPTKTTKTVSDDDDRYSLNFFPVSTSSAGQPGVYFGTGSTQASADDYCLEAPITSGLTITNGTKRTLEVRDGVYEVSVDFILLNTTASELNICEIGLFSQCTSANTRSGYYQYCAPVLYERTVLAEPITIAPGESKLVTYKLTFNQTM